MSLLEKLGLKDRPKNVGEVIVKLVSIFNTLETGTKEKDREKALESLPKYITFFKSFIFGDEEREATKEGVLQAANETCKTDFLSLMVKHLSLLDFETRKDCAAIFSSLVRIKDAEEKSPGSAYVVKNPSILDKLFQGYDEPSIALNCGSMLRDCLRDEELTKLVLEGPILMGFFDKVEVTNFEVASDSFSSFKDALTRHKGIVAQYLQQHYSEFFPAYMKLLQSGNYVTRRQSLKLLGELLLGRSNVKVMVRFVSEPQYLMQMMMLLKDQSRSIQFEAFHVFKVFVCNPAKPQAIVDILTNNRAKLLKYLEEFHTDRDEDEQFKEEKAVIIKEISMLGQPPPTATSGMEPAAP